MTSEALGTRESEHHRTWVEATLVGLLLGIANSMIIVGAAAVAGALIAPDADAFLNDSRSSLMFCTVVVVTSLLAFFGALRLGHDYVKAWVWTAAFGLVAMVVSIDAGGSLLTWLLLSSFVALVPAAFGGLVRKNKSENLVAEIKAD